MQLINKSMYKIRQDHLNLIAQIEENDGELTEELEQALILSEDEFQDKAISYAFVHKGFSDTADIIDAEIKRLTVLKQKAEKRANTFKDRLSEAMKQFGIEKIESPYIKLLFRKSKSVDLVEGFEDNILRFVDIEAKVSEEKIKAAKEAGEDVPEITDDLLSAFKIKASASKTDIGKLIDKGIVISGAQKIENKSLQIK